MRQVTLIIASVLLMVSNVSAGNTVDSKALVKAMDNLHQRTGVDKGSFAIVYGGQDISRVNNGVGKRSDQTILAA